MKCSKCGTECKDTQSFCLNCGNPIQPDPDMKGMEEELAGSVSALLDDFDDDENDDLDDFTVEFEESVFEEEALKVQKELQVDNIYSTEEKKKKRVRIEEDDEEDEEQWDYDEDKFFEDMNLDGIVDEKASVPHVDTTKKKKNKKKIIIASVVIVVVLAIAIFGGMYILNNVHFNLTSFDDYYNIAMREYSREDYKTSLEDANSALKKAEKAYEKETNDEKKEEQKDNIIKARVLISNIYEQTDSVNDEYADNLLEIVTLDETQTKYFPKLAKYYSDNKPPKVLTDFLRTVDDDNKDAIKALEDFIVPIPKTDKESGRYTEQFAVTLTCDEKSSIWYTIDGQDPSTHGIKYTEPVKITAFRTADETDETKGVTVLKAITISDNQVESKVEELTFEIVLNSAEPVVTPDSGRYVDYTEIKIDVPEGSKCYYTIGEGSVKPADPDTKSNLYIATAADMPQGSNPEDFEPLQMPRGTHIMKFILIDEYGIASEIATRSYNLEIPRNITLNDAEKLIDETLLADNIISAEGKNAAGNSVKAVWEETIIQDNDEYYIIFAVEKDAEDKELSKTIYAVNTYDKKVLKDVKFENNQYVLPEEETVEGETETTTVAP